MRVSIILPMEGCFFELYTSGGTPRKNSKIGKGLQCQAIYWDERVFGFLKSSSQILLLNYETSISQQILSNGIKCFASSFANY